MRLGTVRTISLQPDGTYFEEDSRVHDQYVEGRKTGIVRTLERSSIFKKQKPVLLKTLDEVAGMDPPVEDLNPSRKRQMLTCYNEISPILHDEAGLAERTMKTMSVLRQSTQLQNAYQGGIDQEREEVRTSVFFGLSMVIGLVSVVLLLVFLAAAFI